ncbi:MAG: amidohydrolase [Fibrobacter sp.]|nr:amidohydrolase [Fibrobacter sp.]
MQKKARFTKIHNLIDTIIPDVISVRRHLHQHPELSGAEFQTARFIAGKLKSIGISPTFHLNKTAVSARLKNGEGKTIVLRADTDALPITEKTNLPFCSTKKGVMHACGHDMHTAILFGAAAILNKIKSDWKGTVILLFQPSEEVEPGGAVGLIEEGVFPLVADAVFGLHVSTDHYSGTVGVKEGVDYAGITTFDIMINGKGGHGGTPEKTVDPVVCAATMVTELQSLISREKSPFIPAALTIGALNAGTLRNIIPDSATMNGTLRCHNREMMDYLTQRIRDMAVTTAKAFRATAEVTFNRSYPPGFNDIGLAQRFCDTFSEYAGKTRVIQRPNPTMYAEDFSYYQEKVPGLYIHLGVSKKGKKPSDAGLHSAFFNPDESALETGIASHVLFTLDLLKTE